MASLLTRDARDIARETNQALQARDVQGLAFVALGMASGVVIAQEIADRLLPVLGYAREPTGAAGFAVSGGIKFAVALLAGALATSLSGLALAFTSFVALGHLASSGADLFNAVQRTGFFAESPRSGYQPVNQSGSASVSVEGSSQEAYADGGVEIDPDNIDTGVEDDLDSLGVSASY